MFVRKGSFENASGYRKRVLGVAAVGRDACAFIPVEVVQGGDLMGRFGERMRAGFKHG